MSRREAGDPSRNHAGDRTDDDAVGEHPIVFEPADEAGFEVVDLAERQRYTIGTRGAVTPTVAATDGFRFPVDAAVAVTTDRLRLPNSPTTYVRDTDGTMVANPNPPDEQRFPAGEYYLEVCPPIKLYLRIEGPLTISATVDDRCVTLDRPRRVTVGGRSPHERPAGTVTTTPAPEDVMATISTFGSALKTTSPERSFPTLRGHPPDVELGDELSIPDELAPPDTGITVEVPREYRYVYPVASLAHYLGATVVTGDTPRVATDAGFTHDLAPGREFERSVERVLKGTFLLDCVTRTEGLYDVELHERDVVERAVDLDFATLYEQPLAERLEAYLSVPYETLEPAVPDWKLTTYVDTDAATVETLPFVVNDLAVIRTAVAARGGESATASAAPAGEQEAALDGFLRRSRSAAAAPVTTSVAVDPRGSMENAWIGEGAPRGASKSMGQAYRNRLEQSRGAGDRGVTVVCNDPEMLDERDLVGTVYGSRTDVDLDVEWRERLSTAELRDVLAGGTSFLHYIGHIDEAGFRCHDGTLDGATLDQVGVESFLLNACTSYEQGTALIEAGAIGGIVTLAEVVNESAVRVGSTVARLVNNGYPIRPALEIASHASHASGDYIVVGDGTVCVAKTNDTSLDLYRLRRTDGLPALEFVSYSTVRGGMGTMQSPNVGGRDRYYLGPGTIDEFTMSDVDELLDFLALKDVPTLAAGSLHWSVEMTKEDLPLGTPGD